MKSVAIVTGASSGIGREFALQIGKEYESIQEIWVIARRKEALCALRRELPGTELRILPLDLGREESFEALGKLLEREKPRIRLLVNAAGLGFGGRVESQKFSQALPMIDLNCRALTAVTMLCLPYLRKGSRVIQVASGASFLPQPGFAVYAATKAYVRSFSQALGEELSRRDITVTALCPGPVKTDFFRAGGIALSPLKKRFLSSPEKVARKALFDAEKGKALSVPGLSMKLVRFFSRLLPERFLTRLSGKLFRVT